MILTKTQTLVSGFMRKLAYMNTPVGDRIKRRRRAARLTQQQVANAVGVSRVAVSKWERGDTQNLRHAHLQRLSRLLGMSIEDLLDGVQQRARTAESEVRTAEPGGEGTTAKDDRFSALLYHYQQITDEQRDVLFRLMEIMGHKN